MKRLGWRFPLLVLWTALVGLGEGASVVLLLPLLNRAGIMNASGQGAAHQLIERALRIVGADSVAKILALIVIVATLQMVLSAALNWWSVRLARKYQSRRQLELFSAFMHAKWTFLASRKAGDMSNAIVSESARLGRAFTICMSLLGSAVVALIYVMISTFIAWQAMLGLIVFALSAALAMTGLYKKSYAAGERISPLNARLQSLLYEQFAGAKFIKASAGVDRAIAQLKPLVQDLEDANVFTGATPGIVRIVLEYLLLIGLAGILVLTYVGFGVAPANIVIVLTLFGRLFPRMNTVQAQIHYLNENVHSIEAINELLAAAEAAAERHDDFAESLRIEQPTALNVSDLWVRFGDHVVLNDINFTVPIPGLVAVVGRSGAGKSTVIHTLLGLVELNKGSIQLGKYDLASVPLGAWRRTIGYVPQETILFHASIRDNLTLINATASETEIQTAARRAHALEFIELLPDGFDTIIGDQGVKLSGGQRQRLGIARALLMNPALLVMDEAMSALDVESEAELLSTLEELRKQMGILLVVHRLAAARFADTICVFESGRIIEAGSWNELIGRRQRLYALAEAQSLAEPRTTALETVL
jgi:ABC-type multidrug transport system fused ATPase/permease subunit